MLQEKTTPMPEDDPSASAGRATPGPIHILVVSGVRLYREGLASVLRNYEDVETVDTASTLEGSLDYVKDRSPACVVVDMGTHGSHEIVRGIRRQAPDLSIVAFAVKESDQHILACARARVSAFVPSEGTEHDLIEVIRGLARGELICSGRTAAILYRQLQSMAALTEKRPDLSVLTLREREVMEGIARGETNKEIAGSLGIEVATVKNHVHSILEKLRVPSRTRAAALLERSGND